MKEQVSTGGLLRLTPQTATQLKMFGTKGVHSKRSKAQNKARTDYQNQGILGNCVSGEMQEVHQPPEEGDPSCHL